MHYKHALQTQWTYVSKVVLSMQSVLSNAEMHFDALMQKRHNFIAYWMIRQLESFHWKHQRIMSWWTRWLHSFEVCKSTIFDIRVGHVWWNGCRFISHLSSRYFFFYDNHHYHNREASCAPGANYWDHTTITITQTKWVTGYSGIDRQCLISLSPLVSRQRVYMYYISKVKCKTAVFPVR